MIDYTVFRQLIESFLVTNYNTTALMLENTGLMLNRPVGEEDNDWIEHVQVFDQNNGRGDFLGLGDAMHQTHGLMIFKILTKEGIGTERARVIADDLVTVMDNFPTSVGVGCVVQQISFSPPELHSVGPVEGESAYQHNLVIPYTYIYG